MSGPKRVDIAQWMEIVPGFQARTGVAKLSAFQKDVLILVPWEELV